MGCTLSFDLWPLTSLCQMSWVCRTRNKKRIVSDKPMSCSWIALHSNWWTARSSSCDLFIRRRDRLSQPWMVPCSMTKHGNHTITGVSSFLLLTPTYIVSTKKYVQELCVSQSHASTMTVSALKCFLLLAFLLAILISLCWGMAPQGSPCTAWSSSGWSYIGDSTQLCCLCRGRMQTNRFTCQMIDWAASLD